MSSRATVLVALLVFQVAMGLAVEVKSFVSLRTHPSQNLHQENSGRMVAPCLFQGNLPMADNGAQREEAGTLPVAAARSHRWAVWAMAGTILVAGLALGVWWRPRP